MSESKHTPGPWTTNFYYGLRIESEKEHGIVNDGWIIATCEGPDKEENSKLIAAAPELLESLELLIEDLALRAKIRGDRCLDVSDGRLIKAQKAILKAKGDL